MTGPVYPASYGTTGNSKANPRLDTVGVYTDPQTGRVLYFDSNSNTRDKNGKPLTSKNGHTRPLPTGLGLDAQVHTGTKENTDFGGYLYNVVPGSALLLGVSALQPDGQRGQKVPVGPRLFANRDSALPGSMAVGARGKDVQHSKIQPGVGGDLTPDLAMQAFATMDPMTRAQIEYQLYLGGYYAKGHKFVPGAPANDADKGAFKKLLLQGIKQNSGLLGNEVQGVDKILGDAANAARASGLTPDQTINSQNQISQARQTVQLTNPADLTANLRTAFTNALGRAPTSDEINKFVSSYQGSETTYQNALAGVNPDGTLVNPSPTNIPTYTATPTGNPTVVGGGVQVGPTPQTIAVNPQLQAALQAHPVQNLTAPATPANAAAEAARAADPVGAAAYSVGNRAQDFYNALTSSPAGSIQTSKPR